MHDDQANEPMTMIEESPEEFTDSPFWSRLKEAIEHFDDSSSGSDSSHGTPKVRDITAKSESNGDEAPTVRVTTLEWPALSTSEAEDQASGTATSGNAGAYDTPPNGSPSNTHAQIRSTTSRSPTSTTRATVIHQTLPGYGTTSSGTAAPKADTRRSSSTLFPSLDGVHNSEAARPANDTSSETTTDPAAHVTLWGPQADHYRRTTSASRGQTHASNHPSTFRAAVGRDTPSGTADVIRGTGTWTGAPLTEAAERHRRRVVLTNAMIHDLSHDRVEELPVAVDSAGNKSSYCGSSQVSKLS